MGGVLVDEEGLFALLHQNIAVVQLAHHAPGNLLRHGQNFLLHFRLDDRRRYFRRGLRHGGHHRLGGCLGQDHRLPQGHIHGLLDLGGSGNGSFFPGLRRGGQSGGKSLVFLCGHGAEEGLFFCRCFCFGQSGCGGGLGNRLGGKLHLGAVGGLIQSAQNAVVDAVEHRFFRQEFHFRLGRVHIHIHRRGR